MPAATLSDFGRLKYFLPSEFTEPTKMDVDFLLWLDAVRARAGVPMPITSSHRSQQHNAEVGGAADSAHCDEPCKAADIQPVATVDDPHGNRSRFRIVTAALTLGCTRIGLYANGSIHLDLSNDRRPVNVLWHVVDNPAK